MKYCPVVLLLGALSCGIVLDRSLPLPVIVWWLLATALLGAWFFAQRLQRQGWASCLVLLATAAVGGAWHQAWWHVYPANEISRAISEQSRPCCVEAIAVTSPRRVPAPEETALRTIPQTERSELCVWITAIRDGRTMRPASGWADLDVTGVVEHVRAGDRIRVFAQGSRAAAPLNPGEFHFANYARSQRSQCRLFAEFPSSVERLARGSAWNPRRWLADVRSRGVEILRQSMDGERAMLASAVLLGAREQLDPNRNEGYLVTGTIHVLSISGLHVGILAGVLFWFFRTGLLRRQAALAAIMVVTVLYALLTDLQPPVVRAALLVVVACAALWTGHASIGFNSLALAGLLVLVMNPASLFQAGPQLSFLAVATMIAFQDWLVPKRIEDPLDRLIANTRPPVVRFGKYFGGVLWRVWLTGAVIWVISTPLVWRQYHLISPVSLVLNFLMWVPISVAMVTGMATLLVGLVSPPLGRLCGSMCERSLSLLEWSIEGGRTWPGSYYWLPAPPDWWIAVFYVACGLLLAFPSARPRGWWRAALLTAWLAAALMLSGSGSGAWASRQTRPLQCHFVAVGHGLSVLVELQDGRNLLYDAGRLGSPLAGVRPVSAVLWSRGITHLDAIVISHADADHFNAIPGLLERFSVGTIYVSPMMFNRLPDAVKELRESIARHHVPVREIFSGQRLDAGESTTIEVLHPTKKGVYGSDNANSLVLLIEHAGHRVLLTGDLEPPGLNDLLAEEPLDCSVALAPHHGSPRSNPDRFAEWSQPEYIIISGGKALADERTIAGVKDSFRLRGAEVFHTAEDGCVTVSVSSTGVSIATHRTHVRAGLAPTDAKILRPE
jgi:competence protein ComEC